jgi:hypothetical protein
MHRRGEVSHTWSATWNCGYGAVIPVMITVWPSTVTNSMPFWTDRDCDLSVCLSVRCGKKKKRQEPAPELTAATKGTKSINRVVALSTRLSILFCSDCIPDFSAHQGSIITVSLTFVTIRQIL